MDRKPRFAYVVKPDSTVEMRNIIVGPIENDVAVDRSGLVRRRDLSSPKASDKLRPGMKVAVSRIERRPAHPTKSMNVSRLFILRPVATSLLMAAILLAGSPAIANYPSPRCRRSTIRPYRS